MTANRDFKGVWIPREIWLDERLTALDKVILTEVDSLDMGEAGCFASNEHIAEFCQCSARKVTESISKLIECGYVYVESFDGRKRVLRSSIAKSAMQNSKKCEAAKQKMLHSNTYSKTLNKTEKVSKKVSKAESFDTIISDFLEDSNIQNKEEVRELLGEWLKVRKLKRAATTDRALLLNLEKLEAYAQESGLSVESYLKEIICRGWQAFYPIRETAKPQAQKKTSNPFLALLEGDGL